jgi:hypothetical protein
MIGKVAFDRHTRHFVPVEKNSPSETLAGWLMADIQSQPDAIGRWKQRLGDVRSGVASAGYQGTGNAFSVMASTNLVAIACEFVESQRVFLQLDSLMKFLTDVEAVLEDETANSGPMEVQVLGAGLDAIDSYRRAGGKL